MTAVDTGYAAGWSVASAIGTTFRIFSRHFVAFGIIALLAYAPGTISTILWPGSYWSALTGLVTGQIMTVMLVHAALQALRGEKVSSGDYLSAGLKRFGVAFGASILSGIGTGLAFLLLVVPGFVVISMWAVVVPVATAERQGVLGSLPRSAVLTRGRRWRIFGTFVVCFLSAVVIMAFAGVIAVFLRRAVGFSSIIPLTIVLSRIALSLIHTYFACLLATLYYFLRREKEGVDIDHVAKVFD